uniref:F-box domain-containing protein n=1 Tax=Rhabditophanes sp. KR3021 TaxID=114890 RepID=A0AC35TS61_9BILA
MALTPSVYHNISDNIFPDHVWMNVFQYVPLKQRIGIFSIVSRAMRDLVRRSVRDVAFYKDMLDQLDDNRLNLFLRQYGYYLKHINLDLYKATLRTSQGNWRQTVLNIISIGKNITSLDVLICERHKLRDTDVMKIFKYCNKLTTIRIDAQFLTGYCFANSPKTITHLELEMCFRFSAESFTKLLYLKRLKTLHMSQMLVLSDDLIAKLVQKLNFLETLSIVSNVGSQYEELTTKGLTELAYLPRLTALNLEGLPMVNDDYLKAICDSKYSFTQRIEKLSLAHCQNISSVGLMELEKCDSLTALNLDGVKNNDISAGLIRLSSKGNLRKLLLADETSVSLGALYSVIYQSKNLRYLDVTNFKPQFDEGVYQKFYQLFAEQQERVSLVVMTEKHQPWIRFPHIRNEFGVPKLCIYSLATESLGEEVMSGGSVVMNEKITQIPPGFTEPWLRIGNRYRALWAYLGPGASPRQPPASTPVQENNSKISPGNKYSNERFGQGKFSHDRKHCETFRMNNNEGTPRNTQYTRLPLSVKNNNNSGYSGEMKKMSLNRLKQGNNSRFPPMNSSNFRQTKGYGQGGEDFPNLGGSMNEGRSLNTNTYKKLKSYTSGKYGMFDKYENNNENAFSSAVHNTPQENRNFEDFPYSSKFEHSTLMNVPGEKAANDAFFGCNNLPQYNGSFSSAFSNTGSNKFDFANMPAFTGFDNYAKTPSPKHNSFNNFGLDFGTNTPSDSPFRPFSYENTSGNSNSLNDHFGRSLQINSMQAPYF